MEDLALAVLLHASLIPSWIQWRTAPQMFPYSAVGVAIVDACFIAWQIMTGHLIVALGDASVVAVCAWLVWSWWRRRRQGKPSRVLGVVQDLGHKLKVVNVPAAESM